MSHFLERLASNVAKPAGAGASQPQLRPLLGSIYSPARAASAGVQLFPLKTGRSETSMGDKYESAPYTGQPGRLGAFNLPAAHNENEPSRSRRFAQSSSFDSSSQHETPLPMVNTEAQSVDIVSTLPARGHDSAPVDSRRGSEPRLQREEGAALPDLRTVVDLLMRPSQEQPAAPSQALQSASSSARTAGRESAREPDEITIHIGRIEVTAAPQPVARPAAAPARRSISLDEYLKRGNGRAR